MPMEQEGQRFSSSVDDREPEDPPSICASDAADASAHVVCGCHRSLHLKHSSARHRSHCRCGCAIDPPRRIVSHEGVGHQRAEGS